MGQLQKVGFLLESDPALPNVCTLVTGETLRGSWWGHPRSHEIFAVNEYLDDHPDVLITKLVSGKVTFVHRKLWAEIYAITVGREPWQTRELTPASRYLLKAIDTSGSIRADEFKWPARFEKKSAGTAIRELERRMLVYTHQFHTETGAHSKVLETWHHWARRINFAATKITASEARKRFERLIGELNEQNHGKATLPWLKKV